MSINWDNVVTAPAEATEGCHSILYGPPGTGKTSTLDDDNMLVLDVDLEGGSAVLGEAENVRRIDIPQLAEKLKVTQFEAFVEVGKGIESGAFKKYDMIGIDGLTAFQEIVKEYIPKVYAPGRRREIATKFGAQADWGDLNTWIMRTFRWFHTFTKRGAASQHVMWIAHVMEEFDELTRKLESTKVMLQGSSTPSQVMSVVDCYFYMYNKSVNIGTADKPVWDVERGILTKQAGAFQAKARQSKRRDALSPKIIDPKWSEIFEKLGYVRK